MLHYVVSSRSDVTFGGRMAVGISTMNNYSKDKLTQFWESGPLVKICCHKTEWKWNGKEEEFPIVPKPKNQVQTELIKSNAIRLQSE